MATAGHYKIGSENNALSVSGFDKNFSDIELSSTVQDWWRIISGFTPTLPGGLVIDVTAGTAQIKRYISMSSGQITGLIPSATNYIFLQDDETWVVNATGALPGTAAAFWGTATTNATSVLSVDQANAWWAERWIDGNTKMLGPAAAPTWVWDSLNKRVGFGGVAAPAYTIDIGNKTAAMGAALLTQLAAAPTAVTGRTYFYMRAGDVYAMAPDGTEYKVYDNTLHAISGLENKITNVGGVPSIQAGLAASRPAFGTVGRLYFSTDTGKLERDTGAAWVLVSARQVENLQTTDTDSSKVVAPNGSGGLQVKTLLKVDIPKPGTINHTSGTYTATISVPPNAL